MPFSLTPDQFEAIKIMCIYAAGVFSGIAGIVTAVVIYDIRHPKPDSPEDAPRRMELHEDLDHIEQALALANS